MIRYGLSEANLASGADAQLSAEFDEWDEPTVPGLLVGFPFQEAREKARLLP